MNLESKDLYTTCQRCNGAGKYNSPQEFMGNSAIKFQEDNKKCDDCNGSGIKLTSTGLVIKDFIKRIS